MTFAGVGLILNASETADANRTHGTGPRPSTAKGIAHARERKNETPAMSKTLDAIVEAIRNPKHPFRKVDHQPKKALKHRYERRKIKAFLHLSDLQTEETM